jgi:hypothetical protein
MIAAINNQQVHSIILGDSSNPFMDCPNSRTLTLSVFNAMVLYQFVVGPEGAGTSVGQWQPTNGATLPPGVWNFSTADFGNQFVHAVRFALVDPLVETYVSASSS